VFSVKYHLFCLLFLLAPSIVLAEKVSSDGRSQLRFEPATFDQQHRALLEEVRSAKHYAELKGEERASVLSALDLLGAILRPVSSLDELNPNAKIEAYNLQEKINTLLTSAAEDSREVCRREKITGSNRPTVICRTVASMRRERAQAQETIGRMRNPPRETN